MVTCGGLGVMYEEGWGVARSDTLAVQLYRRACDGGEKRGCSLLAEMHRRACERGDMRGCVALGMQYQAGRGVPQNDSLALLFIRRACDGGDSVGCTLVPRMSPSPRPRQ